MFYWKSALVSGRVAAVRHLDGQAVFKDRFVRQKAGDGVARRVPRADGGDLLIEHGSAEVVHQQLMRGHVPVGQPLEHSGNSATRASCTGENRSHCQP